MNFLPTIQFPDITLLDLPGLSWFMELGQERQDGIELGNGQTLSVEDVLEGHYHRLSARSKARVTTTRSTDGVSPDAVATESTVLNISSSDATGARLSATQVAPQHSRRDLNVAIAALAPHLTPLTELAEEVAQTVPSIQPEPQFRAELHRALEQAHKQQTAQRTLGVFVDADGEYSIFWRLVNRPTVIAGLPIVVGILICVWRYRGAHKTA